MTIGERSLQYAAHVLTGLRLVAELSEVDRVGVVDEIARAFGAGYADASVGVHGGYSAIVCAGAAFRSLELQPRRGLVVLEDVVSLADVGVLVGAVTGAYGVGHAAYTDDQRPARALVDQPRRPRGGK